MPTPGPVRAVKGRLALIQQLGGKCARCGRADALELDHVNGRDWEPRKHNRWVRVARYRREAKKGLLQVLCRWCNAAKQ